MDIPIFPDESSWLQELKPGDQVHRFLGPVPMLLKVSRVTRDRIVCGACEFDRAAGAEIEAGGRLEPDPGSAPCRTEDKA